MMGVYIKGMEMPTDCHNCPFGFGGGCYCGTSADEYMCPDHGRADWCHLVPVPPHGRLIDADALMKLYADTDDLQLANMKVPISVIRQNIMDMPTIIPTEGGE